MCVRRFLNIFNFTRAQFNEKTEPGINQAQVVISECYATSETRPNAEITAMTTIKIPGSWNE